MKTEWVVCVLVLILALAGCGDDSSTMPADAGTDGSASTDGAGPVDDSIEGVLTALGVDISQTARLDGDGEALPESYAPLGSRPYAFKIDELLVAGVALTGHPRSVNAFDGIAESRNADGTIAEPFRFEAIAREDSTWDPMDSPGIAKRSALGTDVDADGRDELVVVYQRASDGRMFAIIEDDESDGSGRTEPIMLADEPLGALSHIEVAAGDFDADGIFEVAVVLTEDGTAESPGAATLWVLDPATGPTLSVVTDWTMRFEGVETPSTMSVDISAGNLDDDSHEEIVVMVNEIYGSESQARAELAILDFGAVGPTLVEVGVVDIGTASGFERVLIGGSAIGDVDRDGRPELIVGGLISVNTHCENPPDMVVGTFHVEDGALVAGVTPGAEASAEIGPCGSPSPVRVRAAFVNALDVDGDGDVEVQVNQAVLDFDAEADAWRELGRLNNNFFLPCTSSACIVDRSNTDVAVAELTHDRREEIVYVTENATAIGIWGARTDEAGEVTFGSITTIPVDTGGDTGGVDDPLLVPANVDGDSYAMRLVPEEPTLVFLEPVVVAVLAAAPCYATGQSSDACTTSFGTSVTMARSQEYSFKVTGSIIFGVSSGVTVPVVKVEADVEHKISVALGYTRTHAYEVERSVTYTTGPLEDTVIFTTVPYDRYVYEIIDHPDSSLVGQLATYFIPRDPVTLQVERSFYNARVIEGGVEIGDDIFSHAVGDPSSYSSVMERDALLDRHGGLMTEAVAVGQGDGSAEVGLDVSEEWGNGGTLELGYEFSAKMTAATAIAGFSVGAELGVDLRWSSGVSSSYHGSVGNLSAETFAENSYSFGLFTYKVAGPTGRELEVINYWVE